MMDPLALSTALGALSPLLLAVLVQSHWSPRVKSYVVLAVCVAAGLEVAYASGQLRVPHSPSDAALLFADIAAVYVASQAVYKGLKASGLTDAIEAHTNIPRVPRIRVTVGEASPAAPAMTPPPDLAEAPEPETPAP